MTDTADVGSGYNFKGEYGAIVLKKMVESNRCFFRNCSNPLRYSPEQKNLIFTWQEVENGSRLVSNLKSSDFLISKTIPLLCIDPQNNILYELESSYSADALNLMLNAPVIEGDKLVSVTQTILDRLPEVEFPIPKTLNAERLELSPTPRLYLQADNSHGKLIHMLQLEFLYGEHHIANYPHQPTKIVTVDNSIVKIIRDQDAERAIEERIESFGFEYVTEMSSYFIFAKPSMQVAIEKWREFIEEKIPMLRAEGWEIEIDDEFNFEFEYMDTISVESSESDDVNPWLELSFSVDIGGKSVALMPIVASLLEEFDTIEELPERLNLELSEGKFLHMESKDIKPILKTIFELFDKKEGDSLIIKPYDAHLIDIDEDSDIVWKGAKELKEISQKLKDFKGIESTPPSSKLEADLRDYQQFGLDWIHFLYSFKFGGILADDMGLGKTIQTLSFLQLLKEREELTKPALVIMPTSLIGNWRDEIEKFTPDLNYLRLYGADRAKLFEKIDSYDIILTTYQLAQRDEEKYRERSFLYIILDEAQKIKNPKTKMAVAIKSFKSEYRLALSGTPIENHLGELWSIFDFLMPGFLDNLSFFKSYYQNPIEREHDIERRELLNKKVAPFILRRTKGEVVEELPPKTEIIKRATFTPKQATLYENIRVTMEEKVRETIKGKGLARSHITILDALLKLRQVCCHPQLLKLDSAKSVKESAKLEMFLELIDELRSEGRKVLVFSQFTSMLSIIEASIKKRKITYTKLTGATRKREEAIDKFTKGDAQIFLISLKAGGVGLNLVKADTVIHYDPWWNPAVENQATDRAYRIGQDKAVFVYKLIVENSIEEQIVKLQEKKKKLQDGIYKGNEDKSDKFDGEELLSLLKI
ncbi:COG0553: Superfamily II DNA/RNA helicases, SNF2 family [hydrothermal vent metagenome]|uniref:COG0553: Superfamily II DNA/RNA helicases, SNF2 family n=1 Tax=hydrothermal vent metagenome TaxID=652676 RepID=A0A1W1BAF7_9ZZZZ